MALLSPRLLLAVVALLVLVLGAVLLSRGDHARPAAVRAPTREGRLVGATRVVGVVIGFLVAQAVAGGTYGIGSMLAPTVFGACVLVAVVVGETLVRPRSGDGARSASLAVRRVRDYAPRLWVLVAAVVVLTAGLLLLTTLTASPDPTDGTARSLSCHRGGFSSTFSPYPGAYYAGPLALGVAVVLLVAGLASRQVVLRPRGGGDVGGDDALRRRSLRVVVAATGVAVGSSYVGVASTAAGALANLGAQVGDCAPGWAGPVATVLGLTVLPVAGLVLGSALILLRPGTPRGPRPRAAGSGPRGPLDGATPVGPTGTHAPGRPAR